MTPLDPLWILCDCEWMEHQMRFNDLSETEEDWRLWTVSVEFHLAQHDSIFKRIVTALRYVFGYRSRYGDFGEIILNRREICRLNEWLLKWMSNYWEEQKCHTGESYHNTTIIANLGGE